VGRDVRAGDDLVVAEGSATEGVVDVAMRVDELDARPVQLMRGLGDAGTLAIIDARVHGEGSTIPGDDTDLAVSCARLDDEHARVDLCHRHVEAIRRTRT
jgi:hypothetical protein